MYQSMSAITAAIAEVVRETEKFESVLVSQATDGAQLYDQLETMASVPCAIVVIGNVSYEEHGVARTIRPMLFIVDRYRNGMETEAAGIWDLAEAVLELFAPSQTIAGIDWVPDTWSPVDSPDGVSAAVITLEGVEFL